MESPFDLMVRSGLMTEQSGTLTDAERQDILKRLRTILAIDRNLTHAKLGAVLKCSASVVSQVLAEKYPGDTDTYLHRIRQWLAAKDLHGLSGAAEGRFIPTAIGRQIALVCERTWRQQSMSRICLPAGAGKSQALQHVASKYARVVYVQVHQAGRTIRGVLRAVAQAAGITVSRNDSSEVIYEAIRTLFSGWRTTDTRTPPLLLIDEATTLTAAALNYLRQFHDELSIRAAVVLADTASLDKTIDARRQNMVGGYEQLASRLSYSYPGPNADLAKLIPAEDVAAVAHETLRCLGYGDVQLDCYAIAFLRTLALEEGHYRNVARRVEALAALAEEAGVHTTWSVAELDFAATLQGKPTRVAYKVAPFGRRDERAAKLLAANTDTQPARMAG